MKTYLMFLALILTSLIACKEEKKVPAQKPEPPKIIPTVTPAELHGTWVKALYIEDISKTLSPLKSFEKLNGIALFAFDTAQLKDSILLGGVSYNGHEGASCKVTFKSGKTPRSIVLNSIEGDTVKAYRELVLDNNELYLMAYPTNGSAIGERYVRASAKDVSIDNALNHAVRRTLFAGKWQYKESGKAKPFDVELTDDGTITDSTGYVKYEVLTDFMADAPPSDQIYLFDGVVKRPRILQFKINNDTIKMSERYKKKETPVFQLIRKK